jgi:Ca2+-binding EF-hand superfamily protein
MSEIVGKTKNLSIQTHDDKSVVSSISKTQTMSPTANASQKITSPRSLPPIMSPKNNTPVGPLTVSSVFTLGETSSRDLKDFVAVFQPYAEKTTDGQKLRTEGFKLSDPSNKGYCSLDETENFIRQTLELNFESSSRSEKLFTMFRPSYSLAFAKAKELDRSNNNDNSLNFAEFRVFNADLCIYASMYDAFCKFQSEDLEQPDDVHERITLSEFVNQYEKVLGYGFVGLDNIRTEDAARAIFDIIDTSATGVVTLASWVEYLVKAEIRMKTEVGNLLSGKLQLQVQDDKTTSSNVTGITSPKNASNSQKILNMSFLK